MGGITIKVDRDEDDRHLSEEVHTLLLGEHRVDSRVNLTEGLDDWFAKIRHSNVVHRVGHSFTESVDHSNTADRGGGEGKEK